MKTYLPRAPIRILAFTVIFAMLASLLPAIPQEASAATMPSNPRIGDSEVTWDCVYFGRYPQGANGELETIKWRVLSVDRDEALLLADKSLDVKPYNEEYTGVTWETSTIRSWLNGYGASFNKYGKDYASDNFMNTAFTSAEQEVINQKTIQSPNNPEYGTAGGNPTTDKIFFLSIDEVTNPAYGFLGEYSMNGYIGTGGTGLWWLRSPGRYSSYAAYVGYINFVDRSGISVAYDCGDVRPALFLNLKSNLWTYAGTVSSEGKMAETKAGQTVTVNKLKYKVTKVNKNGTGTVTLTGTSRKKSDKKFTSLKIGNTVTINGKSFKVTAIGKNAFANYKQLEKATIGSNVTKIGTRAFYGCKKLKAITIKTKKLKSKTVGKKAFQGIAAKAKVKVPKTKVKAYKKLLRARGVSSKAKIRK